MSTPTPTPTPTNPYEAPQAESVGTSGPIEVPASFLGKPALGFRLLFGNFLIIAPLVLAVWIPGNYAIETIVAQSVNPDDFMIRMRLANVVEAFFGPLISGAVIYVLAERIQGRRPALIAAVGVGFRNWGRLFGARFVAGLLMGIGLIALIVPGIVLAVRYSMIDEVVVLEGAGVSESRLRSTDLARGRGWSIFSTGVLCIGFLALFGFLVELGFESLVESIPRLDVLWVSVALDCVADFMAVSINCVMFLYYWEGYMKEQSDALTNSNGFGNVDDLAWLTKRTPNESHDTGS